jgi:hypothetical protein
MTTRLYTKPRIRLFLDLCREGAPRDIIAEKLGFTIEQVKGFDRWLRVKGLQPFVLRYKSRRKTPAVLDGCQEPLAAASQAGASSGDIAEQTGVPRPTVASYMHYHGLFARGRTKIVAGDGNRANRIMLPHVSIQSRDDFSEADVRAGQADRAWNEKESA